MSNSLSTTSFDVERAQKAADKAANDLLDRSLETMKNNEEHEAQKNAHVKTRYRIDEIRHLVSMISFSGYSGVYAISIPARVGRDIVSDMIHQLYKTNKAVCDVWTEIIERWPEATQEKAYVEGVLLPAIYEVMLSGQKYFPGKITSNSLPDSFEEGKQLTFEWRRDDIMGQKAPDMNFELSADTQVIVSVIDGLRRDLMMRSVPMQSMPPLQFPQPTYLDQRSSPQQYDPYRRGQPAPFFGPYGMTTPPASFGHRPYNQGGHSANISYNLEPRQLIEAVVQWIVSRVNWHGFKSFFVADIIAPWFQRTIDLSKLSPSDWDKIIANLNGYYHGAATVSYNHSRTTSGLEGVEIIVTPAAH